ncbi:MAG: hypothetical protein HY290_01375 [Planctomycetia bacterium]|nr:hypothetical protein [Planctomycetia bacterium]
MAVWRQVGTRQALRECGSFLMGAAPVLFILGLFKFQIPVSNDLIAGQGLSDTLHRIVDPWRHVAIWRGAASGILQVAQANLVVLPLCFVLLGRRTQPAANAATWPIYLVGLMLAGYYAAYLTTPYDLNWHLSTSADRLLIQVWPLAVMTVFRQLRVPDELSPTLQPAHDRLELKFQAIEDSDPLRRKAA